MFLPWRLWYDSCSVISQLTYHSLNHKNVQRLFPIGRTVKEFIFYNLVLTIMYVFLWLSVFGGVGIKIEREAFKHGIECSSEFGGANSSKAGVDGLYRLSCRYMRKQFIVSACNFDVLML